MSAKNKAYIQLHIAILLFALTAILGDLIQLNALHLVWWRMLIAFGSLLLFIKIKHLKLLTKRQVAVFMAIGVLLSLHWVTFFGAVKLANASVALVCLATVPFLTAFIEPLIIKERINKIQIFFGALVIPGMMLVVQDLDFSMYKGVLVGLSSAVLAATFTSLNKRYIVMSNTTTITFLEMGGGVLFISCLLPFLPLTSLMPGESDWLYLLFLAIGCTTIAHSLGLHSLRQLSAFISTLSINLEPIYGILLAIFVLKEQRELGPNFYLGFGIILCAIFSYPLFKYFADKRYSKGIARPDF